MWHFYRLQITGFWLELVEGTWSDEEVARDLLLRFIGGYQIKVHDECFIEMTRDELTYKWVKEVRS